MKKNEKIENDNLVVYGIYKTRTAVESAVDSLMDHGFRPGDVSVLFSSPDTSKEFAHQKDTKAPEGAMYGGGSGAVVGGTLGLLAGIGMIAVPGIGPLVAAGPIMGALAGAGAGSTLGGITGALIGLGFPEYEAKRFEGRVKEGGILLSVHADNDDWKKKAEEVLRQTGAQSISSSSEASADYTNEERPRVYNL